MKISAVVPLLGLGLALVPGLVRAQSIAGAVVEDASRTPVSGANVFLRRVGGGDEGNLVTDSVGAFHFALADPGRFVMRVTHPSYTTVESDTVAVGEDEAVTVELRVARNAIPLAPLVVTARVDTRLKGFHDRSESRLGFGHYITRANIDRRPGTRVTDLLRSMPGVRIVPVAQCRGCSAVDVIYMRGGADMCAPTVLLDGLTVKQDAVFSLDAFILPDMLEGIEVYVEPSGVPPALGMGTNACGVIALWTRRQEGSKLTWKRIAIITGVVLLVFFLAVR